MKILKLSFFLVVHVGFKELRRVELVCSRWIGITEAKRSALYTFDKTILKIIQRRGESSYNFNSSGRVQLCDGTRTNHKLFSKKTFYASFATVFKELESLTLYS